MLSIPSGAKRRGSWHGDSTGQHRSRRDGVVFPKKLERGERKDAACFAQVGIVPGGKFGVSSFVIASFIDALIYIGLGILSAAASNSTSHSLRWAAPCSRGGHSRIPAGRPCVTLDATIAAAVAAQAAWPATERRRSRS